MKCHVSRKGVWTTFMPWSVLLLWTSLAATGTAVEAKSSLDLVPADAHLYVSVSRLGEHVEKIAKSNWWQKAKANRALQGLVKHLLAPSAAHDHGAEDGTEINGAEASLAALLADPQNVELLALAREMASEEMFVFADKRIVELAGMSGEAMRDAIISWTAIGVTYMTHGFDFERFEEIERMAYEVILGPIREQLDKIAVPYVVAGFRIKDAAKAERMLAVQMERLKKMVEGANLPAPSNTIEETTAGGAKCWVLRLDGGTVPWTAEFGSGFPAGYETIIEHLQGLKGTIAVTVQHGYVLVAVTDTPDRLADLGTGELLRDSRVFAPLAQHVGKDLTGIAYVSGETAALVRLDAADLKRSAAAVRRAMEIGKAPEGTIKDVAAELRKAVDEVGEFLPEPGPTLSFAVTSGEGLEFFTYDHTRPLFRDGSAPLLILDHVGPAPLAFWAGRSKSREEAYAAASKRVARCYGLFEKYVLSIPPPEEMPELPAILTTRVIPFIKRFDRAVRDLWLPALADGQSAIVLDARVASKQWFSVAPPEVSEIAMPLPALVCGVKDIDQLHAGIKDFRAVANEASQMLGEIDPTAGVGKIDEPRSREFPEGTIFWHPLPKEWGVDKRVAPNYGLGENVAAFSLVPLHTQALLARSRLKLPSPLDRRDVPLAAATHIDVPRLSETLVLFAHYYSQATSGMHAPGDNEGSIFPGGEGFHFELFANQEPPLADVEPSGPYEVVESEFSTNAIEDAVRLLRAVPSYTSATRVDGDTTVTHAILRIKDIPK